MDQDAGGVKILATSAASIRVKRAQPSRFMCMAS
jgi:hypothetical protein